MVLLGKDDPSRGRMIGSAWVASNCTSNWSGSLFRIDLSGWFCVCIPLGLLLHIALTYLLRRNGRQWRGNVKISPLSPLRRRRPETVVTENAVQQVRNLVDRKIANRRGPFPETPVVLQ